MSLMFLTYASKKTLSKEACVVSLRSHIAKVVPFELGGT